MRQLEYQVQGMSCGGCVASLTNALQKVDGVEVEKVEVGSASVRIDEGKASEQQVLAAIDRAGFTAKPQNG